MTDNGIAVIVCSKHTAEEKKDFIQHIKDTCDCDAHVYFLINPDGIGLSKIYSDVIKDNKIENNIMVFIHDDIEFLRKGWGKEIIRLFKEHKDYGIIGVAGASTYGTNGNMAWWQEKDRWGAVLHRNNGKSWLTSFSPLLDHDLEEVCVIDGLFMAIHKKRISKNFNTDFSAFDFYDISMCIDNFLDGKTKIGVTTNIRIAHNSIGQMRPSWYENAELAKEKYKDYLPLKVKKNEHRKS